MKALTKEALKNKFESLHQMDVAEEILKDAIEKSEAENDLAVKVAEILSRNY